MSLEKTQSPIKTMNTPANPKPKAETKSYPPPNLRCNTRTLRDPQIKKERKKKNYKKSGQKVARKRDEEIGTHHPPPISTYPRKLASESPEAGMI